MAQDDRRKPNILLIVSDDHGYGDLSSRGSKDASTPHLDRLATEGVDYQNAYVTAPICSPSRAGLIAGTYQQRWGSYWFNDSSFPPPDKQVMPEMLKDLGYRTGYFGKIHYGKEGLGDRACPENHGFDESFYGLAGASMGRLHYIHHSEDSRDRLGPEVDAVHGVSPMYENGQPVDSEGHLTTVFADRAINFMDAKSGFGNSGSDRSESDPFFCMIAFNAVHNFNWQLPQTELDARALPAVDDFDPEVAEYVDWYDGAVSPNLQYGREYYLAQLEIMDREIGRLLEHLEDTGERENTLVVYLTDNGGSNCNYGNNEPLYGTKYSLFEGGVRVPFIMSYPGRAPENSRSSALVSSLDLCPTFIDAAGGDPERFGFLDGLSLLDEYGSRDSVHEVLHFDTGFQWAVRTKDWKLRFVDEQSKFRERIRTVEHTDIGSGLALTSLLHDCDESPGSDVSGTNPEVVRDLMALREDWKQSIGADT